MAKAREEIGRATGQKHARLQAKLEELETRLAEAQENKNRALSLAEQTRRGVVYVISNVGSFGDHVYNVGMTRRLDPMDRVKELGDASVPFSFDVHALIRSEDAPTLEKTLHESLHAHRVNRINERKEFFRVSISEIEQQVQTAGHAVEFTKLPRSEEFRKTRALEEQLVDRDSRSLPAGHTEPPTARGQQPGAYHPISV